MAKQKQETPRVWLVPDNANGTFWPKSAWGDPPPVAATLPYVPESELARVRRQLGQMVMLLLQNQFDEARELALRIPLEFPNGEPSARDESEGQG